MPNNRVGLVLSGGGAKGAYQVGVVKALSEMQIQVDVVAGASIGALNGAVLAAAPDMEQGAQRLQALWMDLMMKSPLRGEPQIPVYLQLLIASGLQFTGWTFLKPLMASLDKLELPLIGDYLSAGNKGLFPDGPLVERLNKFLNQTELMKGLPWYVSVFKKGDLQDDLASIMQAELGWKDSRKSDYIHVQSLPLDQQKDALLASAAIPLLFAARKINGDLYSDGAQGGWQKMQGNTPVRPLIDAGCQTIIVTHLSDGSLWSRHEFPGATIMEIRPQSAITRDGILKDILGFDSQKIPSWIDQGYNDTIHCIGRIMKSAKAISQLRISSAAVTSNAELGRSEELDATMEKSMRMLKDDL